MFILCSGSISKVYEVLFPSVLLVYYSVASDLSWSPLLIDYGMLSRARYMHEQLRVSPGVHKQLHMVDSQSSSFSVVSPVFSISQGFPFSVPWPNNWGLLILLYCAPMLTVPTPGAKKGKKKSSGEKRGSKNLLHPLGNIASSIIEKISPPSEFQTSADPTATISGHEKTENLFFKADFHPPSLSIRSPSYFLRLNQVFSCSSFYPCQNPLLGFVRC